MMEASCEREQKSWWTTTVLTRLRASEGCCALKKGYLPIRIDYFEATGDAELNLYIENSSGQRSDAAPFSFTRLPVERAFNLFLRFSDLGDLDRLASAFGRQVGGKDQFVGLDGLVQARLGHGLPLLKGIEKSLELGLIGVIGHIARISQFHGELAPLRLIQFERVGVKLVIEQSPLAAHQVGVEVVGLEAIQNRSRLAHPAVSELQNGHAGRRVFVFLEVLVLGLGRIARDLGHFSPHHPDEHVKSVTTGRKQTAPPMLFFTFQRYCPYHGPTPW